MVARTAELRAAQNDLVHAGKMAALGQMSAGMVHELNQPLTALRTLSDNAGILLDRRRLDDVQGQPAAHRRAGRPPGRLTSQLKTFRAQERAVRDRAIAVWRSDRRCAGALVRERLRADGIEVDVRVEPPTLAVAGRRGDDWSSVLINLIAQRHRRDARAPRAPHAASMRRGRTTAAAS